MNKQELKQYNKRCNVIKNLILKTYKNDKFVFERNIITNDVVVYINDKSVITILKDNTWKEVKKHIDKKISVQKHGISDDCSICFESIKKNITCGRCSNNMCSNCYINIFKMGKGIITCPHCRYSFGTRMSDYMVEAGVNEIKMRLGFQDYDEFSKNFFLDFDN